MSTQDIFRQVKKVRVSDTVVGQIISLIEDGTLKPGDHLPGERELVNKFQVARASVREALRILEFQGFIEVQSGKGAFIVGDSESADDSVVRRWFKVHASEYLELLEVREALESLAARLAATKASQELIEEMEATLIEADKWIAEKDLTSLVFLDRKFHRLIVDASGNHLLSSLIEMTVDALVGPRLSLFHLPERAKISWSQHRAIFDAIKAHDPILAEQAMGDHMASLKIAIENLKNNGTG